MANVLITPDARKQFNELPVSIQKRVNGIFERLADWPAVSGAKALRANLAGHYRVRTGNYRVQFVVSGEDVTIEKVGHRDGFYEE